MMEQRLANKRKLVLMRFENCLTNLVNAASRYQNRAFVQEAFRKMKLSFVTGV